MPRMLQILLTWFDLLLLICPHQVILLRIIWAAVTMVFAEISRFSCVIPQAMVHLCNVAG